MPNSNIYNLFQLIKSMNASEKRHFKLYAGRLSSNKNVLFLKLFDLIDKTPQIDDLIPSIKKLKLSNQQLTNLKRSLYEQILKSLRLVTSNRNDYLQIRNQIDYAHILYDKGLNHQTLQLLEKLKNTIDHNLYPHLLNEIIEFVKRIESRHITRSRSQTNKMEDLLTLSDGITDSMQQEQYLLNLSLKMQGLYIETGFARHEKDKLLYKAFFDSSITQERQATTMYSIIYWHQCHVWYNYATMDFDQCYRHALLWVSALENQKTIRDIDLYLKGLHYTLTSLYHTRKPELYHETFKSLQKFRNEYIDTYNSRNKMLDLIYFYNAQLNYYIIQNKYTRLNATVHAIEEELNIYDNKIDVHRSHILFYKIAVAYSYTGQYEKSLDYLNRILSDNPLHLRKQLKPYTKLLSTLCHYRLNNFQYVSNQIESLRTEYSSTEQSNKTTDLIFQYLKKGTKAMNFGIDDDTRKAIDRLQKLKDTSYQRVSFLYYDYLDWFVSVLGNTTVERVRVVG